MATKVTSSDSLANNQTQALLTTTFASLLVSADPDTIKQATAVSAYLLNKVNCSAAPNCTQLHRKVVIVQNILVVLVNPVI